MHSETKISYYFIFRSAKKLYKSNRYIEKNCALICNLKLESIVVISWRDFLRRINVHLCFSITPFKCSDTDLEHWKNIGMYVANLSLVDITCISLYILLSDFEFLRQWRRNVNTRIDNITLLKTIRNFIVSKIKYPISELL